MRHLHVAALNGGEICECGHPAEEHAEGYICTHKLDDPEDGWYGVCPCVRYDDELAATRGRVEVPMVSDLTPEERLRAKAIPLDPDFPGGTPVVGLPVALAAVAAERERVVKLLRDEAADGAWVEVARSALRAAADVIESEARVAREGSGDE